MPNHIYPNWDFNTILLLQQNSLFISLMKLVSFLCSPEIFILLAFCIFFFNKKLGRRAILYVALVGFIVTYFKIILHHPRPFWILASIHGFGGDRSFGFPSGHTALSLLLLYLSFFKKKKKYAYILGAFLFSILIAISRVTIGSHFVIQTLAGAVVGGFVIFYLLLFEKIFFLLRKISFQLFSSLLLISFLASLIFCALSYSYYSQYYTIPLEWKMTAHPYLSKHLKNVSLLPIIQSLMLFYGSLLALFLEKRLLDFSALKLTIFLKIPFKELFFIAIYFIIFLIPLGFLYLISKPLATILGSFLFPLIALIILPIKLHQYKIVTFIQNPNLRLYKTFTQKWKALKK